MLPFGARTYAMVFNILDRLQILFAVRKIETPIEQFKAIAVAPPHSLNIQSWLVFAPSKK